MNFVLFTDIFLALNDIIEAQKDYNSLNQYRLSVVFSQNEVFTNEARLKLFLSPAPN